MDARTLVGVRGAGLAHDGLWFVRSVTTHARPRQLEADRSSCRATGWSPTCRRCPYEHAARAIYGKYRATVLNNVDPQLQGRIQVQLADRYGLFPSTWAMPAFAFAGKGAGIVALPQVGLDGLGGVRGRRSRLSDLERRVLAGPWRISAAGAGGRDAGRRRTSTCRRRRAPSITLSDNPAQQVFIKTATGAMIMIGAAGITITNGQGASIAMVGPSVIINNGALTIT